MGFRVGDIGDWGFVIGSGFSFFFTPKNVFTGGYLNIAVSEILFFYGGCLNVAASEILFSLAAVLAWPPAKIVSLAAECPPAQMNNFH